MKSEYCCHCSGEIKHSKFYQLGKMYCSSCYSLYYKLRECVACGKKRRISCKIDVPLCKQCEFQGAVCIKCEGEIGKVGLVHVDGPVCHSCVVYYMPLKKCDWCGGSRIGVSKRRLERGEALICNSCFTGTLPTCSSCGYKRKAFFYDFSKKPQCRICIEETRLCRECALEIPAGSGHYCIECSYSRTLNRRIKKGAITLSPYFSDLFKDFGEWLMDRRGVGFSAAHINKYLPYFSNLDELAKKLERRPNYREIVARFTVAMTRKNLLVTVFLDEFGVVMVDQSIKDEYSNLDMIERHMDKFDKNSAYYAMLEAYYFELLGRLESSKTTVRSLRLAMTPAVKLLLACEHFGIEKPTNDMLDGVMWVSPGQRSAITGFVNFLNRKYGLNLALSSRSELVIEKPKETKMQLKDRLIRMLRQPVLSENYSHDLLILSLAYFHKLVVPDNAWVECEMVKRDMSGNAYFLLAGCKLYLPDRCCP